MIIIGSLSNNDGALGLQLRKCHLKDVFHAYRAYSILFNSSNVANFFWSCERLYQSSRKEKQSRYLVFTFSTKCEIRHFRVVVVQWRQRNVQKRVMLMQSCSFANNFLPTYCFFAVLFDITVVIALLPYSEHRFVWRYTGIVTVLYYRTFQKHANSEVQKPTDDCVFRCHQSS